MATTTAAQERVDLEEAVRFARARLQQATEVFESTWPRSLFLLRARMVATDELRNLMAERQRFEDDRSVEALRQADLTHARRVTNGRL